MYVLYTGSWLQPFGKNDVIGCYIDTEQCTAGFSKNGEYGPPTTHTQYMRVLCLYCQHCIGRFLGKAFDIPKHLHGETFYAAVTLKVRQWTDHIFSHQPVVVCNLCPVLCTGAHTPCILLWQHMTFQPMSLQFKGHVLALLRLCTRTWE